MEKKNVSLLVAVAIILLVATSFVPSAFAGYENEVSSDTTELLVTVAEEMTYHPLSNIMLRRAGGKLFSICGLCKNGACPTGCRCRPSAAYPGPYCEGNCC